MDKKTPDTENRTLAAQRPPEDIQHLSQWMAEYGCPMVYEVIAAVIIILFIC